MSPLLQKLLRILFYQFEEKIDYYNENTLLDRFYEIDGKKIPAEIDGKRIEDYVR